MLRNNGKNRNKFSPQKVIINILKGVILTAAWFLRFSKLLDETALFDDALKAKMLHSFLVILDTE